MLVYISNTNWIHSLALVQSAGLGKSELISKKYYLKKLELATRNKDDWGKKYRKITGHKVKPKGYMTKNPLALYYRDTI